MAQEPNPFAKYVQHAEPTEAGDNPFAKYAAPAAPVAPKVRPERTMTQAVTDTGRALASGVGGVVKGVGTLGGLATGNMDNAVTRLGTSVQDYWQEGQSDALKHDKAERSAAIDAADGVVGKGVTAIKETLSNPSLFVDTMAETAASFIPAGAAGRAGALIAGGRALSKGATAAQAGAHAGKVGTAAGIGTGAVQQAAEVTGDTYSDAMGQPDAKWEENPAYTSRIAAGESPEAVKHDLALAASRAGFVPAAAISVASQFLPGGATLERTIAGAASKVANKSNAAARALNAGKGFMGEGIQEAIEEGGGAFVGNLMQREFTDPTRALDEGVGEAGGMGFVGGAGLGGVAGAAQRPRTLDGLPPNAPKEDGRTNEIAPELLALPPPGAITVTPDGVAIPVGDVDRGYQDAVKAKQEREAAGLSTDVNAARAAHPGAAPNTQLMPDGSPIPAPFTETLPDGSPIPDPSNGPLSRATNVGMATGAVQQAAALQQMQADQAALEQAAKNGITGSEMPPNGMDANTGELVQQSDEEIRAYVNDLIDRGNRTPAKTLAQAFGRDPIAMRDLIVSVRDERKRAALQKPATAKQAPEVAGTTTQPAVVEEVSDEEMAAYKSRNRTTPAEDGDTWDTARMLRDKPIGDTATIMGPRSAEHPDGGIRWTKQGDDRWTDGKSTLDTNGLARVFDNDGDVLEGSVSAPRKALPHAPSAKLPEGLSKAAPRYNYGKKAFELDFASDADRAAYIAAQDAPSKRDADYLAFAMDATGLDEAGVRARGREIRESIKAMAKDAEPGRLALPAFDGDAAAPSTVKPARYIPAKGDTVAVTRGGLKGVTGTVSEYSTNGLANVVVDDPKKGGVHRVHRDDLAKAAPAGEGLQAAADQAATSPNNDLAPPTKGQKKAGNYQKGHYSIGGHNIAIENPRGSKRDPKWKPLAHDYGYIKGTVGADKDHVDVFLTENAEDVSRPVFVVDQVNKDGSFDEHKVVMGAANEADARKAYLDNYDDGWAGLGAITQMTQEEFKGWVRDPAKTRRPAGSAPSVWRDEMAKALASVPADHPMRRKWEANARNGLPHASSRASALAQVRAAAAPEKATAATPSPAAREVQQAAPDALVPVRDIYGSSFLTKQSDLDGPRTMLPTYTKDGTRRETVKGPINVHRENLATDEQIAEHHKDTKLVSRQSARNEREEGFTSPEVVTRQIKRLGQNPADFEIKRHHGGYVGVRKPKTEPAPAVAKAHPKSTAPEHVIPEGGITPMTPEQIKEVAREWREHIDSGGDEAVTRVFEAPQERDRVRLEKSAGVTSSIENGTRVYHRDGGWMTLEEAAARVAEWRDNARSQGGAESVRNGNSQKVVLSLFDKTGSWAQPWADAGYQVYTFDIQDDPDIGDVNNFSIEHFVENFGMFEGNEVYAVLAACPCTDFAVSGARHFAGKDADGRTQLSVQLVNQTLATVEYFKPPVWAIENPVGRIEKLTGLPPWTVAFDPYQVGPHPYTKRTQLWGRMNGNLPTAPVEPTQGSMMHSQYGGKSQKTKDARSETPEGFAYAFFQANNAVDHPVMAIANRFDRLDRDLIARAVNAGITEKQIATAVEDDYYDLNDDAANAAIQELIDNGPEPETGIATTAPVIERAPVVQQDRADVMEDLRNARQGSSRPVAGVVWHFVPGGKWTDGTSTITAERLADAIVAGRDPGNVDALEGEFTKVDGKPDKALLVPRRAPNGGVAYEVQPANQADPLLDARNDLIEVRTKIAEQGSVVDDRLLARERQLAAVVKELEAEAAPAVAANTIFTEDAAEKARAVLRAKLGQLNTGIDPEIMQAGITLAGYHIEKGARTFAAYSKAMVADLGDAIRPYLKSWYMGVKFDPRAAAFEGMDSAASVESAVTEAQSTQEQTEPAPAATSTQKETQNVRRNEDRQSDRAGDVQRDQREQPAQAGNDDAAANLDGRQRGQAQGDGRGGRADADAQAPAPGGAGSRVRGADPQRAPDHDRVPADGGPSPDAVAPKTDLTITGELDFTGIGPVGKFKQNIAAIELLKTIESEGRRATPEEQSVLAKYVGWGGLPQAFRHPTTGKIAKGWDGRVAELEAAMTADEIAAAGRSTQDAHYTSAAIVSAMWSAVERMGFKSGRVLEPSMGTGNFFGLMPAAMRGKSNLTGVELDSITGRIAKQLYQTANVQVRGFNDIRIAPGSFDLAIGNPPFGAQSIHDTQYPELSKASIHNFFFAKSIASLRPGGVLAMVVSSSFLDANTSTTRAWVAERANLLGAVRLPQTAFMANAGTNVTTDIVFLQRVADGEKTNGDAWVKVGAASDKGNHFQLNRYYLDNPEMMLGSMVWSTHTTVGRAGAVLEAHPGVDLAQALNKAIDRLPEATYKPAGKSFNEAAAPAIKADKAAAVVGVPSSARVYGYFVDANGALRQRLPDYNGEIQSLPVELSATATARVVGMAGIRDLARDLLASERDEAATDAQIDAKRAALNTAYDAFVKDFGRLSRQVNVQLYSGDSDVALLLSLERDYDKGVSAAIAKKTGVAARKESAKKADLFTKRLNYPTRQVTEVSDAKSAMLASLNELGRLDADYMAGIYKGKSPQEIEAELGDAVFRDSDGSLVPADLYLSGNVKAKLAEARKVAKSDPSWERNVAALEKVQPADVDAADIFVQVGTPWIPVSDYDAFARATFEGSVSGGFVAALGGWRVHVSSNNKVLNKERWGHERMGADEIFATLMAKKPIAIYDKGLDDKRVLNTADTAAAKGKAEELERRFLDWLWEDAERRERLSRHYNDHFNTDVRWKPTGEHLTFPGKSGAITLRPHQSAFVYRVIQQGVALADHVVGAGKTFANIAAVMEMRRLGLWRKPMIAVPNHLVEQWAKDFAVLYPGANVLAASRKDFTKQNRKNLFARIATGDWDAVIVAHSSFGFIPLPKDVEEGILNEEVAEITSALDAIRETAGKKDLSFKELQKRLEGLQEKIKALNDRPRDDLMDFAEMGIDALSVDEAHEFKNLFFVTSQRSVAGLGSPAGSKKAFDLYAKTRYLSTINDGKNRVFLTGTPVSNSLAEVFHMQRYLQLEQLKALNVHMFDSWASTFGQIVSDWEMDAAGRFKEKSRFRRFANLPELVTMWRGVVDTVTLADLKSDAIAQGKVFPMPKIKGGKRRNLTVPRSPLQAKFIGVPEPVMNADGTPMLDSETGVPVERYAEGSIVYRMDNMPKDPSEDNHLKATGDARKASLDYRLVDPDAPDFPGSKINRAVDEVLRIWTENANRRGTQLIFADLSVPSSARGKATQAAQDRLPTWFVNRGGSIEHVPGVKLSLSALPGRQFFSYKTKRDGYAIYEAGSGVYVTSGKTKQEAVDGANAAIANGLAEWTHRFDQGAIPAERIEAYVQEWQDERDRKAGEETESSDDAPAAEESISMDDLLADQSKHSVYDDVKAKLIAKGIPEAEIAFIHDYNTDKQKADLFARVNRGDVRVLMGSTAKMGAGMNVQKKLVALHHLDAPWRPSDMIQREGRILRQGNEFYEADPDGFEVELIAYGTQETYDSRQYEIIETKAQGIETFQAGDASVREIDDISSESASSADMKAAASGNPLILESIKLRKEVRDLEAQQKSHTRAAHTMESTVRSVDKKSAWEYRNKARAERMAKRHDPDGPFSLELGGKAFTDAKEVKPAAILTAFKAAMEASSAITVGSFRGLEVEMNARATAIEVSLRDPEEEGVIGTTSLGREDNVSPSGFVTRLENIYRRIAGYTAEADARVAKLEREADQAREELKRGFPREAELLAKRERQAAVVAALRSGKREVEGDSAPAATSEAKFSLPDAPVGKGMTAKQVSAMVGKITAGWGAEAPRVEVVGSPSELPDTAKADNRHTKAEGYYDDATGTVYLVASNLRSPTRAKQVLVHEVVGHYGIEAITGEKLWREIGRTIENMRRSGKNSELFAEIDRRYRGVNRDIGVREAVAVMAEKGVRNSVVDRAVAAVRRFVRSLGIDVAMSDAELRQHVVAAARYVRGGSRPRGSVAIVGSGDGSLSTFMRGAAVASSDGSRFSMGAGLQERVLSYFTDEHSGHAVSRELGDVLLTRVGVKASIGHGMGQAKAAAFELVPHVIAGGRVLTEDVHFRGMRHDRLTIGAPVSIAGEPYLMGVVLKRDVNGTRLYLHDVLLTPKKEPLQSVLTGAAITGGRAGGHTGVIARILLDAYQGKLDAKFSLPDDDGAASRAQGAADADRLGLRAAVDSALGPVSAKVNYVRGLDALPQRLRDTIARKLEARGGTGRTAALYDPRTKEVYLFTDVVTKPESAVWNVAHEIAGHEGLRTLLGERLKPVLEAALKNETVKDLAEIIAWERGIDESSERGRLLAAEEALAELAAAVRTGDYSKIESRYGVEVPAGMRSGVKATVERFLQELRALIERAFGPQGFSNQDVRALLEAAWQAVNGATVAMKQPDGASALEQVQSDAVTVDDDLRDAWGRYYDTGEDSMRDLAGLLELRDVPKAVEARLRDYLEEVRDHDEWGGRNDESGAEERLADAVEAWIGEVATGEPGSALENIEDPEPTIAAVDSMLSGPPASTVEAMKQAFRGLKPENLRENTRPAWLGALALRHLAELGKDIKLRQVGDYANRVQQMATDRNTMQEEASGLADAWESLQRENRQAADDMANLMHDSTLEGVDPSKAYAPLRTGTTKRGPDAAVTKEEIDRRVAAVRADQAKAGSAEARQRLDEEAQRLNELLEQEAERKKKYPELVKRYDALPAVARKVYVDARDTYTRQSDRIVEALVSRINALELDGKTKAAMIGKVRQQFEEDRLNGPYFPLQRFGEFWISAESKTGDPAFFMYEKVEAWREAQRELKAGGYAVLKAGRKLEEARSLSGASGGFMADLQALLDTAGVDGDIRDDVYQLYLRTLPELSMRKHQIHRKGTAGYSNDALRAFSANLFHGSFQIARLRHSHELDADLLSMKEAVGKMTESDPETAAKAAALYTEATKRHEWVMNPRDSKVASGLTSLGFAWYLGTTPAAAIVNLTQTAIVAFPVLASRFGVGKSFTALSNAMGSAMRSVTGDITHGLPADEQRAFKAWYASGAIDRSQAHNLAGLSETDTRAMNPVARRTMQVVSFMFHKAEVVNREATALAAYRLARESGMGAQDAITYAGEVVTESHFDYTNANRPRWMQSNAAKVLLLFRQYSLNMTWFLWRNAYVSLRGESPEVRVEARKKLAGVLGMTGVFAGALGMPLSSVLFGIANAAAAAFGDDDEEPWDAEVAFRNALSDMLGKDVARIIANGPADYFTGASFSTRVGLDDLWFREPNRELEGKAMANYLLEQAAGPLFGGMLVNTLRGMQLVGEGHTWRGVETMMPKAIKDGMKAMRYGTEGVQTLRGDPVIEDLNVGQALLQLAGFAPSELNDRYDGINASRNFEQKIMDRRSSLLNAYAMAWRAGDADTAQKVLAKIRAFNKKQPEVAINADTIRQSMQARMRYSSRAEGGVVLNPKLAGRSREQGRFAD